MKYSESSINLSHTLEIEGSVETFLSPGEVKKLQSALTQFVEFTIECKKCGAVEDKRFEMPCGTKSFLATGVPCSNCGITFSVKFEEESE